MSFNVCLYIFITITLKTLAEDGKQKRIMNMNVVPVVSALLLSFTHCISTNVCTVFKRQQLDIARKWKRYTFEDFFFFAFANYNYLVKSNTLIKEHINSISFFTLFFSRKCMFY